MICMSGTRNAIGYLFYFAINCFLCQVVYFYSQFVVEEFLLPSPVAVL